MSSLLITGEPNREVVKPQPMSPELRMEAARLDELRDQATLLGRYRINTQPELESFITARENQIGVLEKERQHQWNKLKARKPPERTVEIRERVKDITKQIKPLRKELKTAKNALNRADYLNKLLDVEHRMEQTTLKRETNRHHYRNKDWGRER